MKRLLPPLVLVLTCWLGAAAAAAALPTVQRFAVHESSFEAAGEYENPYVQCTAEATVVEPDGRTTRQLPLFWDGGRAWKLRFAPDRVGTWRWSTRSADRGLDGRAGAFECVASNRRGSVQPRPGAPHHFQYQNGEHMWFMGDTAWALVTDSQAEQHNRPAAERYLKHRAAQGFNVVHFMMLNEAGWGNSGGPPWSDIAAQKLNPGYFQEADARVAFANAQGIVTGLALAWGNKGRDEPWSWGRFPDVAARQRYARYIAARFGAYAVYFLVSGEWHGEVRSRSARPEDILREFVAIGDALQAADAHRRMIGIHPMTAHGSTREFNTAAAWMSFADYQQNYTDLHGRALIPRTTPKPVVNSEYAYYLRDQNGDGRVDKPHSYAIDDIRHATWDLVMAGAYVITGFGSTYMGGHRHPTPFLPDDPKNAIWAEQIGRVKAFFAKLEYWKLAPHDELVTSSQARTKDRNEQAQAEGKGKGATITRAPAATYWCLAEPGQTYAVYVRGTTERVRLQVPAGGGWQVRRYNPRSGQWEPVQPAIDASALSLAAPDQADWVFVVSRRQI